MDRVRIVKLSCLFKGDIMGTALIIIGVIGALICYSACALPKSEYERRMDDEEQMKYIREYNIKHGKI